MYLTFILRIIRVRDMIPSDKIYNYEFHIVLKINLSNFIETYSKLFGS
jgi:hypothetical protein